jgi:transcriptional regulator with XRE-family HTH domain
MIVGRLQRKSRLEQETKTPHPVDIAVGARVRTARVARGLSQAALAEQLGLTFQQVQKYERGANRISASKLVEIAQTLELAPAEFLQGLDTRPAQDLAPSTIGLPGAAELLASYARLSPQTRRALVRLARDLAGSEGMDS